MMNLELIERVKQHLRAEPRRANMGIWLGKVHASPPLYDPPPCGTVGCIAGFALFLAGLAQPGFNSYPELESEVKVSEQARKILALPNRRLFFVHEWPVTFSAVLTDFSPQSPEYVEVLCRVIDDYVSTNGWPEPGEERSEL